MPPRRSGDDVLRQLVAETASATGREFFSTFVRHLAQALGVSHVFITEVVPVGDAGDSAATAHDAADSRQVDGDAPTGGETSPRTEVKTESATAAAGEGEHPGEGEGEGARLRVLASWQDDALGPVFEYRAAGTPCERVLANGVTAFEDRVAHRFPDWALARDIGAQSYVGVPLRAPTGEPLGHLCVVDREKLSDQALVQSTLSVFAARVAAEFLRLRAEDRLATVNQKLEEMVQERTQQLAEQNTALLASNRKLEDLNHSRDRLMRKLNVLRKTSVRIVRRLIAELIEQLDRDIAGAAATGDDRVQIALRKIEREIHFLDETLRPISSLYQVEQAMHSKRVLLAETDLRHQVIAKMALRGTGVELDIASSFEEGRACLADRKYDVVCTNAELIELTSLARAASPKTASVFMTAAPVPEYLPLLDRYSHLCNIVSRDDSDRTFTLKNILATVGKLISQDLFGLEKYLSWGVDVQQRPVTSSGRRAELIGQMDAYFQTLGIRRVYRGKAEAIVEELLMNAIYDAPLDGSSQPKYNHLARTVPVELEEDERGVLRYACDGVLLAMSVEDPFGGLDRETILHYLRSCYEGTVGAPDPTKGGAGRGLFQVMEMSDLLVINVKPRVKTEVIAILNLDPDKHKRSGATSFHYFYS